MAGPPPPGQQPTPQQMAAMQQAMAAEAAKRGMTPQQFQAAQRAQLEADAKKAGLTFDQYIAQLKEKAIDNHRRQQQLAQQPGAAPQGAQQLQQSQQVPINPGSPDPRALALAKWLRGQDLKTRTCILNGQRKDLFRVKRALRAIESPAYAAASAIKNSPLPALTPSFPAPEIFKLLPLSLLALRISKADPHEGHGHAPPPKAKHTKGLWHVKIEQQQDIAPDLYYVFLYEGPQWRTKFYAGGGLALLMTVIMFPLWPVKLRIGVWYLSMGMVGLIGLFFVMAIFRLLLFAATVFTVPPGLWLYPNLFEDVGFFDSFRPVWGWQEEKKKRKSRGGKGDGSSSRGTTTTEGSSETPIPAAASDTSLISPGRPNGNEVRERRNMGPRVVEVEED